MRYLFLAVVMTAMASAGLRAQDTSAQYLGKYKFPDGSVVADVEVTIDNGKLIMSSSAGTSNLDVLGKDSFNIVTFNGYAVFRRNETKRIVAVHIEASGYVLDGVKDSVAAASQSTGAQVRYPSPAICFPENIYTSRQAAEKALIRKRRAQG